MDRRLGAAGAAAFRIVAYDQPRGCAAAYYPETNPLVPLDHVAEGSNCPASKSVIVRLVVPSGRASGVTQASDEGTVTGGDDGDSTKRKVEPKHHG